MPAKVARIILIASICIISTPYISSGEQII